MTKPYVYIPTSLSEINDLMAALKGDAPTFRDKTGWNPDQNIDTQFFALTEGFALVRPKLGEARYAELIELAAQAKALFAADQEDTNGKTDEGYKLLFRIEDIIRDARRRRVKEKLPDDEDEVTGD